MTQQWVQHKTLGVSFAIKPFRDHVSIADGQYYETEGGSFIAHTDKDWELMKPAEVWKVARY